MKDLFSEILTSGMLFNNFVLGEAEESINHLENVQTNMKGLSG